MDAIQVIGAGGIGCAVGYALRAAGRQVLFVDANPAKVEAGRRDGVRVDELPALGAEFAHFADWRPNPNAPALLCTKCYDNADVLAKLPVGVELVPIQNGFDPQLNAFEHAYEGIASFVSECAKDRPHTRITRKGALHVGRVRKPTPPAPLGPVPGPVSGASRGPGGAGKGEKEATQFESLRIAGESAIPPNASSPLPAPPGPREAPLTGLGTGPRGDGGVGPLSHLRLGSLFHTIHVPAIEPIKHAKLMYNAAISPIAAAAGIDNGQLLSVPSTRKLFFALLQENDRILRSAKIELGKVGPFHPRTVAWILRRKWLARVMARFFEPSLRGTYCSMAGEIQKGRTEIDNYNGHLIRLAEVAGVPCPLNRAVYELVVQMTARREQPRPDVLRDLNAVVTW